MELTLKRPDDWHLHLRDGAMLAAVLPHTAASFGRALVMPNLVPPITSVEAASAYRDRICAHLAPGSFEPQMTCYLTDDVDSEGLIEGWQAGVWRAAKLYPANATTNSAHGVTDLRHIEHALHRMAEAGMPLCVHGELTHTDVDVFDRERRFIEEKLGPLGERLPALKVVFEHATTKEAVAFVKGRPERTAATITPHHLWWNRNALFDGGLRPHAYCLPVLKREEDRQALLAAATSGNPAFFAGTDSAPHSRDRKECDHGCAGVFNAPTAVAAYAHIFEEAGALDQLEGFLSLHGAAFYEVPPPHQTLTLLREPWTPPEQISVTDGEPVRVFLGGQTLNWRVAS